MILFITLCHSFEDIRMKFIEHTKLSLWLKTLLLDSYDSLLKREAQLSIYRLCMVSTNHQNSNNSSGRFIIFLGRFHHSSCFSF